MPFDPTKPATNAPVASAELRDQLTSLKALIDAIPGGDVTQAQLTAAVDAAIQGTSNNSNAVGTLGFNVTDPPTQGDVQTITRSMS